MTDDVLVVIVALGGMGLALSLGVILGYLWGSGAAPVHVANGIQVTRDAEGRITGLFPEG